MTDDASAAQPAPAPVPFLSCSECQTPIRTHYYALNERPVCAKCRAPYAKLIQNTDGPGAVLRHGFNGALVAIVGAVVLAMVGAAFPAARLFVVAPLGFLVGKRMMKSLDGYSDRRYQYVAAGLTYVALFAGMYAGTMKHESDTNARREVVAARMQGTAATQQAALTEELDALTAADSAESGGTADGEPAPAPKVSSEPVGPGPGLRLVLLLFFPLFSMMGFGMAFSAVGVAALGYSLYQAWHQTDGQARHLVLSGPFKVGQGPIAAR